MAQTPNELLPGTVKILLRLGLCLACCFAMLFSTPLLLYQQLLIQMEHGQLMCTNLRNELPLSAAAKSISFAVRLVIFNNVYLFLQGSGGLSHYYSNSSLKTERIKSMLLL